MPNLDSSEKESVTFKFIQSIEFFTALYRTANIELLLRKRKEWEPSVDDPSEARILEMHGNLSPFLQRELKFFFGIRHSMVDQAFHQFAFLNPNMTLVPELLEHIEATDPSIILRYMSEDIPESDVRGELVKWIERRQAGRTLNKSVELERFLASTDGERIAECLANPTETKGRFVFLVRGFYIRSFQPIEHELATLSDDAIPDFERTFRDNPNRFFATFVRSTPTAFKKRLDVHVSVLNPHGISSTLTDQQYDCPDYIRLGMETRSRMNEGSTDELVELFTKAVSDKRRLEILHLLSRRPMYGQEIANHLQLTSAAVSYHMAFFYKLELVFFEREENKVYYGLDKRRLAELMSLLNRFLLPSAEDVEMKEG